MALGYTWPWVIHNDRARDLIHLVIYNPARGCMYLYALKLNKCPQ